MKKLYEFKWDWGRMGTIEGLFIADEEEVKKNIGKQIYLGEVLGKHSEIAGTLKEGDFTIVSADQNFIKKLAEFIGTSISGYNPLDYIDEED